MSRDLIHALSGKIIVEDLPDDLRPFLIDHNLSALNPVSEGHGGREEGPFLHACLIAPAHIAGDALALLLGNSGEHGGEQFAGYFRGVDALLLEAHPHADGPQLPDRLQVKLFKIIALMVKPHIRQVGRKKFSRIHLICPAK